MKSVVMVEWTDSISSQGWRDDEDFSRPATIVSVGWQVGRTKEYVRVSASYDADSKHYSHCDAITIPMGAVRSIKRVQLPKKKGK